MYSYSVWYLTKGDISVSLYTSNERTPVCHVYIVIFLKILAGGTIKTTNDLRFFCEDSITATVTATDPYNPDIGPFTLELTLNREYLIKERGRECGKRVRERGWKMVERERERDREGERE